MGMSTQEAAAALGQFANLLKGVRRADELIDTVLGAEQRITELNVKADALEQGCLALAEREAEAQRRIANAEREAALLLTEAKEDAAKIKADAEAASTAKLTSADAAVRAARAAEERAAERAAYLDKHIGERQAELDALQARIAEAKAEAARIIGG